jgi:MFS family permease
MAASGVLARPGFRTFWGGQFVSDLGAQLSLVALPCALVLALHAGAWETGALQAVEWAVIPVVALAAGVLVDRWKRKPIMIGANLVRVGALATLPTAAALHALTLAHIFVVAALVGATAVLFDTAYQAYLPTLAGEEHLVEANEKMTMGASTAEAAGTSLAGALVQLAGAPFAIALNAGALILATFALLRVRADERPPLHSVDRDFLAELREGFRVVLCSPVLRTIALANATNHLGWAMSQAVFFVYAFRELHLAPVALGIVLAVANVGIAAAGFAGRIARAFGLRRTLVASLTLAGAGLLILPFASLVMPLALVLLSRALNTLGNPVFEINQAALRTQLVPAHLHGRMNATMRALVWGTMPIGSLAGGALGAAIGLVPALVAGGLVALAAALWLIALPRLDEVGVTEPVGLLAAA